MRNYHCLPPFLTRPLICERNMKNYARTAKKITTVLFLVQSLSSAGFIAVFTVNALVGAELSGQPA